MAENSLLTKTLRYTKCPYCREELKTGFKFYNIKKTYNSPPNDFRSRTCRIMSDNLCDLLDLPRGSCMYWGDILRNINKYIISNGLYDKQTRTVTPDDKLLTILHPSYDNNSELKIFHILKYVRHNFSSLEVNISQLNTSAIV